MRLFHGGIAGLHPGDLLVPSPPHVFDGCPICRARAEGRVFTVGEYIEWVSGVHPMDDRAQYVRQVLEMLEGVPAAMPIDLPSAEVAVYVTTSELYATWYAARSAGDLYRVKPLGRLTPSTEDHFESYTVPRARVLQVVRRNVVLTPQERAEMYAAWTAADEAAS
jgi:hypothetical protein